MTLPCLVGLAGTRLGAGERRLLAELRPAGVLLFRRNVRDAEQLASLCGELLELLGDDETDPILAADHEGGAVSVLETAVGAPPSALALGLAGKPELTRAVHRETGRRARSVGVNLLLAPVADVVPGANRVLSTRSFGSTAAAVGRHVQAAIAGLHDAGVAACAKHWPGHGRPLEDSHLELPRNDATLEELMRLELPPFVEAFEAGAECVMVGHLAVPALDATARLASCSSVIVEEWLRGRLEFSGMILSDALEMSAFSEAPAACLEAGCDLVLLADPIESQEVVLRALGESRPRPGGLARLAAFRTTLRQTRREDRGASEGEGAYLQARREGVSVLWPETSEMPPWPLARGSRPSWSLLDAASADRLVRSPADGALRVDVAASASRLAPRIEAGLGPPSAPTLLLPPPGQGGFASIRCAAAVDPLDLVFLASLRPFSDAEWALIEPRLNAKCAIVLLGDLSAERRLPHDRGVLLVPGVREADIDVAVGLLKGSIPAARRGRWGD